MKRNIVMCRMSLLATAVAAALLFATPATAQGPGMSQEEMQKMMQERQAAGGGMGSGMMMGGGGMGPMGMLNLSDEQRAKVRKIEDEQRKKNRDFYGKIEDESVKLRDLYDTDTPDAKKIGAVYDKIFDLKRQAIVSGIEANNKARAVLTKEQREQLKQMRRGGMGMGGGMMGR